VISKDLTKTFFFFRDKLTDPRLSITEKVGIFPDYRCLKILPVHPESECDFSGCPKRLGEVFSGDGPIKGWILRPKSHQ
jgi:hypothetical protein